MLASAAKSSLRCLKASSWAPYTPSKAPRFAFTNHLVDFKRLSSESAFKTLTNGTTATEDPTQASTAASSSTSRLDQQPQSSTPEVEKLKLDLEAKEAATAELKHKYLAALADFQNLQVQSARREKDAKEKAIRSFAKDLVSDVEVLKLALESVPAESRTTDQGELVKLWDGVDSTKKMLENTLARFGVKSFDPTGEVFDPNKHDAQYKAPVPGKQLNTVICSKVGWMLHDSILRPAEVGVVSE